MIWLCWAEHPKSWAKCWAPSNLLVTADMKEHERTIEKFDEGKKKTKNTIQTVTDSIEVCIKLCDSNVWHYMTVWPPCWRSRDINIQIPGMVQGTLLRRNGMEPFDGGALHHPLTPSRLLLLLWASAGHVVNHIPVAQINVRSPETLSDNMIIGCSDSFSKTWRIEFCRFDHIHEFQDVSNTCPCANCYSHQVAWCG